ncbi:haloalkane dehalogenase [Actinoplanes teichomyceticus]|uniref:Haloalkane dehalogenase n=1 Tax=Actinoplanes teichomyceticus TaxID=1867 RepID=A0A561WBM2_ACTTI|nr:haloalkane dehalogenase [Actinoplanes teichomyceticus]TWG21254.1 haloalkane dehalogenase [Actinoplanes teichomyceticus]GIF16733.1 haloalkane dehalogenase 3 [Actinoplanes teichomyceticus]
MTYSAAATIPATDPHPRRRLPIEGSHIEFVDTGAGDPIVFLHGNPTSSYLWRNVIPAVADLGRCLAPDLIGMGRSGPAPDGGYRFADHVRYLDAWFDAVTAGRPVTLVLHDWGSALGFHWAARHPQRVRRIAYLEALVQPRLWSDFEPGRDTLFRAMRSADGERLVLGENYFVEQVLPRSVLRTLTDAEMQRYREPFGDPGSRLPTLTLARELPIEGEPADVTAAVAAYGAWLATSTVPKLLIRVRPGALLTGRALRFARTFPAQRETSVAGIHYPQEDSPHEIGAALRAFLLDR